MWLKNILEKTAKETELSQAKVRQVVRTFFKYLSEEFKTAKPGDTVIIQGYGTFKVVKRAPRKARNSQTGEEIEIPARKILIFKPLRAFVEELKE